MNNNDQITFTLTIAEANTVLEGLSGLPYGQVYQLIQKIQTQANEQNETPSSSLATDGEATE